MSRAVRRRAFSSREAALQFVDQELGGGAPARAQLGPLRVELEDHPCLDFWREGCELLSDREEEAGGWEAREGEDE